MLLSPARAPVRCEFRKNGAWLRFPFSGSRKRSGTLPQTSDKPLFDLLQMLDLVANLADLVPKLLANLRTCFHLALQVQQLPNLGQREAEGLRLLDERQMLNVALGKQAEPTTASKSAVEQLLLLVEADGIR
jgi:hypothetical protein